MHTFIFLPCAFHPNLPYHTYPSFHPFMTLPFLPTHHTLPFLSFPSPGRTLGEVEFGERTLEAAEAMVEGSTKVFVLSTKFMNRIDVPKFIYQVTERERERERERKRERERERRKKIS